MVREGRDLRQLQAFVTRFTRSTRERPEATKQGESGASLPPLANAGHHPHRRRADGRQRRGRPCAWKAASSAARCSITLATEGTFCL